MTICEQMPGLGYEGIRTFCRFPLCTDLSKFDGDVAVLGFALDTGTTNRCGARYGPQAIREGSMIYSLGSAENGELFDVDVCKTILNDLKVFDCGDIPTPPTLLETSFEMITDAIQTIRSRGGITVVIGGDHSISIPIVRGLSDTQCHVVQFDAHLDLMDDFMGMKYTHGNPMKRILEMEHISGLTQIGIRGLLNGEDWVYGNNEPKTTIVTAEEVHDRGAEWSVSKISETENLYISIDIDVLDPKEAPGTGTPEFGGLSYRQLVQLLRKTVEKGNLVGLDIVEVNPLFDPTGRTGQLAARLILDTLGAATIYSSSK